MNKQIITYYSILVLFLGALFSSTTSSAQQYTETDLKVAYLYNFTKFVTWPTIAFRKDNKHFVITVLGTSPAVEILQTALKNKTVQGKAILIRQISEISEIQNPQILFIPQIANYNITNIVDECSNRHVLLVADHIEYFCELQGIINFTDKHDKYRFEINNKAALKAGLKISSKLLSLSRIINGEEVQF
jgi:hypothetical protein